MMQNSPAPKGEAVDCFLAGCTDGNNTEALRREVLTHRHNVHPAALAALTEHAWGTRRG